MAYLFEKTLFDFVCNILPEHNNAGEVQAYFPQNSYKKKDSVALNPYGAGPFCKFRIPKNINKAGVYIITVNDVPYYVGECVSLSKRFNTGYGQISPRNCYIGGQSTNCRLNNLIYNLDHANTAITLLFHETNSRFELENKLISALNTQHYWNRKS